jgi:ferredoxin-NADP reductase
LFQLVEIRCFDWKEDEFLKEQSIKPSKQTYTHKLKSINHFCIKNEHKVIYQKRSQNKNKMKQHIVKIQSVDKLTHDVLKIVTEKPKNYPFVPGEATEISINKNGWKDQKSPYTFTSLPEDNYLEFIIKIYPSHKSMTNELSYLKINDELILHDIFGAISYKGEGVFIAGGVGLTQFISIFRDLESKNEIGNNKLIFANKTKNDIILEKELKALLGANFINILSDEKVEGYANGQITKDFIQANSVGINKLFYLCGPPSMKEAIEKQLADLKSDEKSIITETF